MKTAILIPTFPRYRPLAEFTAKEINKMWCLHPPIYLCGCSGEEAEGWLPVGNVENLSWTEGMYRASLILKERGNKLVYLILDDHPPIRRCNEKFLNDRYPYFMQKFGAAYLGLLGWGQGQGSSGENLGPENWGIERVADDFQYKLSLHPGLWSIDALTTVLKFMLEKFPNEQTPWKFEKSAGMESQLRSVWNGRCYRIDGLSASAQPWFAKTIKRQRIWAKSSQNQLETYRGALRAYYHGPYPLMWSGVMHHGKPNPSFPKYLRMFGMCRLAKTLNQCLAQMQR